MKKLPLPQQNQIANLDHNLKELSEPEILTGYVNNNEVQSNIHNYLFNRNGDAVQNLIKLINNYTQNNKDLVPADLFSKNIPHLYYQFDDPIQRLDTWQCISDRHGNVYQLTKGWIKNNKAYSVNSVELFENASFAEIKKYINKLSPAPTGNGVFGYNDFAKKMINSGLQFKLISKAQGYLWHKTALNCDKYIPVRGLIDLVNDQMLEQEMFLPMFNDLQQIQMQIEIKTLHATQQRRNSHRWVDDLGARASQSKNKYLDITLPISDIRYEHNDNPDGAIRHKYLMGYKSNPYLGVWGFVATDAYHAYILEAKLYLNFNKNKQAYWFMYDVEMPRAVIRSLQIQHIKIIQRQGNITYDKN